MMNGFKFVSAAAYPTSLATGLWIVWALVTPGDHFANGNVLVGPSLFASLGVGSVLRWDQGDSI